MATRSVTNQTTEDLLQIIKPGMRVIVAEDEDGTYEGELTYGWVREVRPDACVFDMAHSSAHDAPVTGVGEAPWCCVLLALTGPAVRESICQNLTDTSRTDKSSSIDQSIDAKPARNGSDSGDADPFYRLAYELQKARASCRHLFSDEDWRAAHRHTEEALGELNNLSIRWRDKALEGGR